jgi:3-oxoacyl-[acyl-carrier-protein] synthase-3
MMRSKIAGTGSYLPEKVLTNDDLAKMVDTSDEWIFSRTGMKERRIAADGEMTSDLAANAAVRALAAAGMPAERLDLIIVATTTPDNTFPATACKVQAAIGAPGAAAFDVQAVCTGFVYALSIADAMIRAGGYARALVIGAETMSRIIDWNDRGTCVLFGDGAGAVVLEAADGDAGILSYALHSDGREYGLVRADGGPSSSDSVGKLVMDGKAVFKLAVENFPKVSGEALAKAGMTVADVDWFIPHQANVRIIDAALKHMDMPGEKVVRTIERQANTSAASIGISLDIAVRDGRIRRGDDILLTAMGGGFTWGAMLLKY